MSKSIILYAKRNVGMIAMSYLVAQKYEVKVISDDLDVIWLAESLGLKIIDFKDIDKFDLLLCVHGTYIFPKQLLDKGLMVNIHPCLSLYRGKNPIARYIANKDEIASVESHYMTPIIDGGEVIHRQVFETGIVTSYAEFYNIAFVEYYKCIDSTLKKIWG